MKKSMGLAVILFFALLSRAQAEGCGEEARATLQRIYPKFLFKAVIPTSIAGVCEVVTEKNSIYYAPATGYLILGEIWSAEGKNIATGGQDPRPLNLSAAELAKAVKIGHGPQTVIEFTDPDCPHCRRGAAFFVKHPEVTRYVFFFPLDGVHPSAAQKAEYILAATDPGQRYEEVMAGGFDQRPLPVFTANGLLNEHRRIAARLQVSGTPSYLINGQFVAGFNAPQLEGLLPGSTKPSN